LTLTVLSGIAEFERDLILQRTNEGRMRPCRGHEVQPQAEADQVSGSQALKRLAACEPLRGVALSYNVDHSTISRFKSRHAAKIL
jgi:DNA invertase Pin-like site-specific DNA recombinase